MKPILEIRHLSKAYRIGARRQRYLSLRENLAGFFSRSLEKKETFWALDDVSFDVMPGECVGVIGRNGAGKSTLLKILSRITPPTKGKVKIRGRLASLLEVGTGFHPELSGRENIFFNGSILGLKRREIMRQFDAIVDFSGVEQFLETPLKHYSSGMQLRLAFAVAAHLEPEILLIDEVLAVGDTEFQKKCLGKMDEVARSGRTVLFVSHNMGAVRQLCVKGLVLDKGSVCFWGGIGEAASFYNQSTGSELEAAWTNFIDKNDKIRLEKIEVRNAKNELSTAFFNSEDIFLFFHTHAFQPLSSLVIAFDLHKGDVVVCRSRQVDSLKKDCMGAGENRVFACKIPAWMLNAGRYSIHPLVSIHCTENLSDAYDIGLCFEVELDPSRTPYHTVLNERNHPGVIFPTLEWQVR